MREDETDPTDPQLLEGGIRNGDRILVKLVDGTIYGGQLVDVMSGEGQTDGMLRVEVDEDARAYYETPVTSWIYERHILVVQKGQPAPAVEVAA